MIGSTSVDLRAKWIGRVASLRHFFVALTIIRHLVCVVKSILGRRFLLRADRRRGAPSDANGAPWRRWAPAPVIDRWRAGIRRPARSSNGRYVHWCPNADIYDSFLWLTDHFLISGLHAAEFSVEEGFCRLSNGPARSTVFCLFAFPARLIWSKFLFLDR